MTNTNQKQDGIEERATELAQMFHNTYERLAPEFGYETRDDTKVFDPESPNGRLMIAVVGELLDFELLTRAKIQQLVHYRNETATLTADRDRLKEALRELLESAKYAQMETHETFTSNTLFDAVVKAEKIFDTDAQ